VGDDDERTVEAPVREHEGGPRGWVVLLGTAAAAAIVLGGVFAYQAWRDGDADDAAPATAPETAAPDTAPEAANDAFLFRRTTAEGIEIRARLNDFGGFVRGGVFMEDDIEVVPEEDESDGAEGEGDPEGFARAPESPTTALPVDIPAETFVVRPLPVPGGAIPDPEDLPPECQQIGDLMAWAISDTNVVQGSGPWTKAAPDELFPSLMWDGMGNPNDPDAESIVGAVLQVPDDVTSVRMTTPAGAADEMEPVDGAVVLAVVARAADVQDFLNGMGGPRRQGAGFQVTARRADGSVLTASAAEAMTKPHPAWGPECQPGLIEEPLPPPETTVPLPPAGAEQPADPDAARAEIEHNFGLLYGPRDPDVDRSQYIDDNYGMAEINAAVARRFPGAAEGASVTIDEIVFTDASNAMFRYTLDTPLADFPDQLGRARLLDGVWKITRGTLCQDMAHGQGICGP
jgi:hypothetical protein